MEEPVAAPLLDVPAFEAPVSADPVTPAPAPVAAAPKSASTEEIAKLAYSYWESRGYQGGDAHEDWVRAEQTLLTMTAAE